MRVRWIPICVGTPSTLLRVMVMGWRDCEALSLGPAVATTRCRRAAQGYPRSNGARAVPAACRVFVRPVVPASVSLPSRSNGAEMPSTLSRCRTSYSTTKDEEFGFKGHLTTRSLAIQSPENSAEDVQRNPAISDHRFTVRTQKMMIFLLLILRERPRPPFLNTCFDPMKRQRFCKVRGYFEKKKRNAF